MKTNLRNFLFALNVLLCSCLIMPSRAIAQLITAPQQREGGGFLVRRVLGSGSIKHIDPFLLLDHVGTYIANFGSMQHTCI